ncbi:MAG: hypothetical protein BGP01_06495 [Paludibacter sp. 47-17]|nr:MAG: hypothetical protein BGP01_06495 [Paludibacter sp. 47-17]
MKPKRAENKIFKEIRFGTRTILNINTLVYSAYARLFKVYRIVRILPESMLQGGYHVKKDMRSTKNKLLPSNKLVIFNVLITHSNPMKPSSYQL